MKQGRQKFVLAVVMLFALTAVSCGEGFNSSHPPSLKANGGNNGGLGNGGSPGPGNGGGNNPDPVTIDLDGKVSGGIWDGKEVFKLDLDRMEFMVRLPVDFGLQIVGGSFPIPGMEEIAIELVTDMNGTQYLQVRIALATLLGEGDQFVENGLPNGDPLPMVGNGGKLPRYEFNLGSQKLYFYVGRGTIAVFVPTKFNPYVSLIFPIKNQQDQNLGYFATVAKKGDNKGGFYAATSLPDDLLDAIGGLLNSQK